MSLIYGVFEMNKFISLTCLTLTAGLFSVASFAGKPDVKGNGSPSGAHYNLNIIGMDRDSSVDGTKGNGHRIFVKLYGNSKIWLKEGSSFKVTDYNGLDNDGAEFQLPKADANCDGWSDYSVFARALGKPGGSAFMTTCIEDKSTHEVICSEETLTLSRSKGPSKFTNVSKELLTIYYYDLVTEKWTRTPLFGDDSFLYFWDYDNNGLRLAQLRFYDEYNTWIRGDEEVYNCE
jgi:hypothetical protein